ncbi:MAG: T9SS type A sorting domain-containing protein [candidate division Zixibacteria bacterium]|nr:T9SS type A sorting domain-containing protein [candidate division Zixibacteria bacterium]
MKLMTLVVILTLLTSIPASSHTFMVVDFVPQESDCGILLYGILQDNYVNFDLQYETTFIDKDWPDVAFFITGVASYNQGSFLPEEELQVMREYLSYGGDAFVFGLSNILFLTPENHLGLGMITQDPQPTDSLWCDIAGTVFENMVFEYDESQYYGAYYMMPWQAPFENICLLAQYGMSGSPRGVSYIDTNTGRRTITLNMDLTMITEGRNSAEELVMTALVDYFGYDPTSAPEEQEQIPQGLTLAHNYPNPFNSRTTIAFTIPENGDVTLEIYDLLGRKVKTLVEGSFTANSYKMTWDSGNYASGIYFYRLRYGDSKITRRMSLVK